MKNNNNDYEKYYLAMIHKLSVKENLPYLKDNGYCFDLNLIKHHPFVLVSTNTEDIIKRNDLYIDNKGNLKICNKVFERTSEGNRKVLASNLHIIKPLNELELYHLPYYPDEDITNLHDLDSVVIRYTKNENNLSFGRYKITVLGFLDKPQKFIQGVIIPKYTQKIFYKFVKSTKQLLEEFGFKTNGLDEFNYMMNGNTTSLLLYKNITIINDFPLMIDVKIIAPKLSTEYPKIIFRCMGSFEECIEFDPTGNDLVCEKILTSILSIVTKAAIENTTTIISESLTKIQNSIR